jgi:murein DD-endopeptidase MepM/ murein hydrolase activator NlpD
MPEPIVIIRIVIKAAGFINDNWKTLLPAFLALLLFPYFIYITVTNILLPQIDEGILDSYKQASEKNQISLNVLLSYDTIRYFNNMSKADPGESVFDFLVIDWRVYEVEEVTKRREEVIFKENIVDEFMVLSEDKEIEMAVEKIFTLMESGNSSGYRRIRQMLESKYFSYSSSKEDMTIPKVVDYLNDLSKTDQYIIDCYILSAEEIVSSFTREEIGWFNGLSSMLAKMYPEIDLGPATSFVVMIPEGMEKDYIPSIWPARGRVTSYFGELRSGGYIHKGLDIGTFPRANIYAASSGKVIYAGWQGGYGNTIMIHHGSDITTLYGHLEKILIKYGQIISKGDVIGLVGSTGKSTGPHLHYEIRVNGKRVDPMIYLQ